MPPPSPPSQLPLPWRPPPPPPLPPLPLTPVPPRRVWTGLPPPQRAQLRLSFVALLQEVARVADAAGEDHPAPS
jgi:hypothetical protein